MYRTFSTDAALLMLLYLYFRNLNAAYMHSKFYAGAETVKIQYCLRSVAEKYG